MIILLGVISAVGTVTGVGMLVPQAWRVRQTGSLDGVSIEWIGVGFTMNAWWLAYALQAARWGMAPVALCSLVLYVDLARSAERFGRPGHRSIEIYHGLARGGALLSWVPLVFLMIGGWRACGLAIGLCYAAQFAPATIAAWRSQQLEGLSSLTWALALVEAIAWLAYGLLSADLALITGGSGASLLAAAILVRLWNQRAEPPKLRMPGALAVRKERV